MAKRANPFTEDFVPQSKIHIGVKQFNNNEDRLQKVYEKTLKLLFKGAKKPVATDQAMNSDDRTNNRDKMKQLFLGKDGTLVHSGQMVDGDSTVRYCSCGMLIEFQCDYCERSLCGACQHTCGKCQHTYCARCSLFGFEGTEVCVSCYS